jgi:hypothetical protein
MKKLRLLKLSFLIAMLFGASTVFADINPINILMNPVATSCGHYDIDLNVQQYQNVANISMTLDISSLVNAGAYTGITMNTTAWPALSNAITYINPAGKLKVSWTSDPNPANAMTLPDNTVLFTLHFDVTGIWGTSHDLTWDDVLTIDCELSGPNGYPIYADYWNDLHWDIQDELEGSLSHSKVDFDCPNPATGSIDLTVGGGVAPYTYSWTGTVAQPANGNYTWPAFPGATTEDLSDLYPGQYCVVVTDADFCVTTSYCVTINQLPLNNPGEVGNPVSTGMQLACYADIANNPFAMPVVNDACGQLLQPEDANPTPGGTYNGCEGTVTYTYDYLDFLNQAFSWTYTYTIEVEDFVANMPADAGSQVACAALAVEPTPPVVADYCGNTITPTGPTTGGTYVDCEGTITYTWNYEDCEGNNHDWVYTYTVEVEDFTMPADGGETIECTTDLYTPNPPSVNDYCGDAITPTFVGVSPTPACEGNVVYTWNYEDCEGNNHDWTYTFTIDDTQNPTITAPADVTVYMNAGCTAINVDLGTPVTGDNCGNPLPPTNDAPAVFPEGMTLVTWTVTDCAGNSSTDTQWVEVLRNSLSGTLVYNNIAPFGPDKIMNNVDITLYDNVMTPLATSTTGYLGGYSFPDLCAGTYYIEVQEHNKPAGGVNTTDAGQIVVYAHTPYATDEIRWLAGDVNADGVINVNDAGKTMLRFVYGDSNPIGQFGHYWNYYWVGSMNTTNSTPPLPMSIVIGGGNATGDIFGQCTGDFNGNFAPGVMKSANESLTLDYGQNVIVDVNTEFELPVYAGMDMKVGAVSLIMDFPSDDVEITDVFFSSDPESGLQYNVNGNELRIGWYSLAPVWLNEGESLVTLKMKMKTSTEEGIYFSLVDSQLNELADGDFDVFDATLIIDIPSKSALGFGNNNEVAENIELSNHPNPFIGTTTLTYSIPENGEVTLEIYDMIGNKMKVEVDATQDAGNYSVIMDANELQPGIYTAILKYKTRDAVTTRAIKMISK